MPKLPNFSYIACSTKVYKATFVRIIVNRVNICVLVPFCLYSFLTVLFPE